jgi:signal transduction histidine kinase
MPEWARYALFRIYQAAVDNVAKHAHATELRLRLRFDEENVHLSMADDGQGFEVPPNWLDFARTARYGLLLIQERTDALRGRMMVQSSLGSGTRVAVQVPLDQPSLPMMFLTESLVSSPPLSAQTTHITPSRTDRNG